MTFQEQIDAAMEQIRPALQADGGDIEVLEVQEEEGLVLVAFSGACGGLPHAESDPQELRGEGTPPGGSRRTGSPARLTAS